MQDAALTASQAGQASTMLRGQHSAQTIADHLRVPVARVEALARVLQAEKKPKGRRPGFGR